MKTSFRVLEIATAVALVFSLVLFTLRPDDYSTGFSIYMVVALAVALWLFDRTRRRL